MLLLAGNDWFGVEAYRLNAEVSAQGQDPNVIVGPFPDVGCGSRATRPRQWPSYGEDGRDHLSGSTRVRHLDIPVLGTLKEISEAAARIGRSRCDGTVHHLRPISMKVETGGFEDAKIESSLKANARFKQAQKGEERREGSFPIDPLEDDSEEG